MCMPTFLNTHACACSYAEGFASQWDNFYTQIEPLAARIPWMMADGNQLGVRAARGACATLYKATSCGALLVLDS